MLVTSDNIEYVEWFVLRLSDNLNSIHYRDNLRVYMNKILDCLIIPIVISTNFLKKIHQ